MMKHRTVRAGLIASLVWGLAACDLGAPKSDTVTPEAPVGGETFESPPVLIRVEGTGDDPVEPGQVVTLVGLNFSRTLSENVAIFTTGTRRVPGLPLSVRREPAEDDVNFESRLEVVVPGGVSRGQVELIVRGQSAGAAGLDVTPYIAGFTIGITEAESFLRYAPRLGFEDGASRVTIYGTSLTDVQEAIVSDSSGNTIRIPSSTFSRSPGGGTTGGANAEPSGLDSIAFDLRDDSNDVRLPFSGARGNLGVELRGPVTDSNRLEIPVTTDQNPEPNNEEIGFVVSSVKVPVGIVTGAVPIDYTCYELGVNSEWAVDLEFRATNEQLQSDWTAATVTDPTLDPENRGSRNVTAGAPLHRNGNRLLPGIGLRKRIIWDPANDPAFRAMNDNTNDNGLPRPRYWRVDFRLRPLPDTDNRTRIDHIAVSPPIVYLDLLDRPGDPEPRSAILVEDFNTADLEDTSAFERVEVLHPNSPFGPDELTDQAVLAAVWGPPINPGLLSGNSEDDGSASFGTGTARLVLENVDPAAFLSPGEILLAEWIEFDTTRMEIIHHVVTDNATPDDPADDVDAQFVEVLRDGQGERTFNPGVENREFHFATLEIRPGTIVTGTGDFPLIIRLSGADDADVVFHLQSSADLGDALIDLDGLDGGNSAALCPCPVNCGHLNGGGGVGGAGGGRGGDGGQINVEPAGNRPRVTLLTEAQDGGNDGGVRGGTPAALHFDGTGNSLFVGAPGGGGGHRLEGSAGTYDRSGVAQYQVPDLGFGGPVRGDATLFPLTAGSGGGGGGATASRIGNTHYSVAGAGGGGGGGALRVVANGSVVVDGLISANGGNGGNSPRVAAPVPPCTQYPPQTGTGGGGGGGSGGAILIQSNASIDVAGCDRLQVEGGVGGGTDRGQGQEGGAGAPGYVRLESVSGGLPFCGSVSTIVDDAAPQPRDLSPIEETPDVGRGQDGVIHISFIPSLDPITGEGIVDDDGDAVSIWSYDTTTGRFTLPDGDIDTTRSPGVMDVSRLIVDEGVTLRVFGDRPLVIRVREEADIAGTIDVSGFSGGELLFSAPGREPLPGVGGLGGPAGARGGDGGTIRFADGDSTNADPSNTIPIDGGRGGVIPGTEQWNEDDEFQDGPIDDLIAPSFRTTTGGASRVVAADCDDACTDQLGAGGGAGGGHAVAGQPGVARPATDTEYAGIPGTAFGFPSGRFAGELFLNGGQSGSGGGAFPATSSAYLSGRAGGGPVRRSIVGTFPFPGAANFAPGTGGGGGGGVLVIVANSLVLRSSARLLARGGDAIQSIDLGGNGGAGAGGLILVQIIENMTLFDGYRIDVRGGRANRLPPLTDAGILAYEGNVRARFLDAVPADYVSDAATPVFGGRGGDGAAGRVIIEAPASSGVIGGVANPNLTAGSYLDNVVTSVAVSEPIALGLGAGFVARSFRMDLESPRIVFGPVFPVGTNVHVLWQGAAESLDVHGAVGDLRQLVRDPRLLSDREYVRYISYFRANLGTRNSMAIDEVRLPYRLSEN